MNFKITDIFTPETLLETKDRLTAYARCKKLEQSGIEAICNKGMCTDCDLCYRKGNNGEHLEAITMCIDLINIILKNEHQRPDDIEDEMWRCMS